MGKKLGKIWGKCAKDVHTFATDSNKSVNAGRLKKAPKSHI